MPNLPRQLPSGANPLRSPNMENNDNATGVAAVTNPAAWNPNQMNAMDMNMNQQQQQQQQPPPQQQQASTQQQMSNVKNNGINPMNMTAQQQQQLQQHQKLQMMQLHQRLKQQQQSGGGGNLPGQNVIQQQQQQQQPTQQPTSNKQQQRTSWNGNLQRKNSNSMQPNAAMGQGNRNNMMQQQQMMKAMGNNASAGVQQQQGSQSQQMMQFQLQQQQMKQLQMQQAQQQQHQPQSQILQQKQQQQQHPQDQMMQPQQQQQQHPQNQIVQQQQQQQQHPQNQMVQQQQQPQNQTMQQQQQPQNQMMQQQQQQQQLQQTQQMQALQEQKRRYSMQIQQLQNQQNGHQRAQTQQPMSRPGSARPGSARPGSTVPTNQQQILQQNLQQAQHQHQHHPMRRSNSTSSQAADRRLSFRIGAGTPISPSSTRPPSTLPSPSMTRPPSRPSSQFSQASVQSMQSSQNNVPMPFAGSQQVTSDFGTNTFYNPVSTAKNNVQSSSLSLQRGDSGMAGASSSSGVQHVAFEANVSTHSQPLTNSDMVAATHLPQSATSSTSEAAAQGNSDQLKDGNSKQQPQLTTSSASSGGTKASSAAQRRHTQVVHTSPLTYVKVADLASKCSTEQKIVWVARQILGSGSANGFQKATSTMQRLKRQKARSFKQKETSSIKEAESALSEEDEEERLKRDTFTIRVAKRMQSEMKQGLQFCNLMQDVIRSILEELDPENPVLLIRPPTIGEEESFKTMPSSILPAVVGTGVDAAGTGMTEATVSAGTAPKNSSVSGANNFPSSSARLDAAISKGTINARVPESPSAARKASLVNSEAETAAEGNPNGSTLRKHRTRNNTSGSTPGGDLDLLKMVGGDHDESTGKKLSKREVAYRLFEATRFRTLEVGDYVAARMASHDLWILARVARKWNAVVGTSYKQLIGGGLSETKRDALFKEKVYIQDNDEFDGNSQSESARAVGRQNVLPLPRSFGEASDWAGTRIRKGARVYAMYPKTTALYCGSALDSTTYCRDQDDIIVVQFDGDEDDKGIVPQRHIPARFVTLIPREFPACQLKKRRKSATTSPDRGDGVNKKKRSSSATTSLPSAASSAPRPNATTSTEATSVDDKLLKKYGADSAPKRNFDNAFSLTPQASSQPIVAATGQVGPPPKLPLKRKSSQPKLPKRSKKQKRKDDANNPNLASSHF